MDTSTNIIEAARACLLADGFVGLSTRKVADAAGVPLSQIHYHFGGKKGLVLALLEYENRSLVDRQTEMYAGSAPLSARYDAACDFLDADIASGYVRVLQEMISAAWSDPELSQQVFGLLQQWFQILEGVAREAEERFGSLGPFSAVDVAQLIGMGFLGAESLILLGDDEYTKRAKAALRRVGDVIREAEKRATA